MFFQMITRYIYVRKVRKSCWGSYPTIKHCLSKAEQNATLWYLEEYRWDFFSLDASWWGLDAALIIILVQFSCSWAWLSIGIWQVHISFIYPHSQPCLWGWTKTQRLPAGWYIIRIPLINRYIFGQIRPWIHFNNLYIDNEI